MDDSLEIKKMERKLVELIVAKELTHFAKEAGLAAIKCIDTGKAEFPDTLPWARKIIAIVKEHSI